MYFLTKHRWWIAFILVGICSDGHLNFSASSSPLSSEIPALTPLIDKVFFPSKIDYNFFSTLWFPVCVYVMCYWSTQDYAFYVSNSFVSVLWFKNYMVKIRSWGNCALVTTVKFVEQRCSPTAAHHIHIFIDGNLRCKNSRCTQPATLPWLRLAQCRQPLPSMN